MKQPTKINQSKAYQKNREKPRQQKKSIGNRHRNQLRRSLSAGAKAPAATKLKSAASREKWRIEINRRKLIEGNRGMKIGTKKRNQILFGREINGVINRRNIEMKASREMTTISGNQHQTSSNFINRQNIGRNACCASLPAPLCWHRRMSIGGICIVMKQNENHRRKQTKSSAAWRLRSSINRTR